MEKTRRQWRIIFFISAAFIQALILLTALCKLYYPNFEASLVGLLLLELVALLMGGVIYWRAVKHRCIITLFPLTILSFLTAIYSVRFIISSNSLLDLSLNLTLLILSLFWGIANLRLLIANWKSRKLQTPTT